MDKEVFSGHLNRCVSNVFEELRSEKEMFEFGIFANQDVSTISFGYNTSNHFANQLKDHFLSENKIASSFRWTMPEWHHEVGDENKHVNELNGLLYDVIQPQEFRLHPDDFKDHLLDLLCDSLLFLKNTEQFRSLTIKPILYLEQADSYIDDLMKARVKMLIGEDLYKEFLVDLRDEF